MAEAPRVSLVIPVYDEADNLPALVAELGQALAELPSSWEAILVDDGSRDGSWELIRRTAHEDPRIRGLRLAENRGQTAAFAAGFRTARGELIVTLDADLQNDPADVPAMIRRLEEEQADVVLGIRRRRNDNLLRRLSSRVANAYRRWRTRDDTVDTGCSLKVFRARFLRELPLFTGMHRFFPTLARLQGARKVVQMEVNHRPRTRGVSKYGVWNRLWVGLADVRSVRWMQKRQLAYRVSEEVGEPATKPDPS